MNRRRGAPAIALAALLALAADDPDGALPEPWRHGDVGAVAVPGAAHAENGTFTITGTLDIWGTADSFHFVYRPLDGDGTIVARVDRVMNTNEHAKAGVMVRESLDPGARHAAMVVTPVDDTQFLRRATADAPTTNTNPGRHRGVLPCWVKLVRRGDTFRAYESSDGSAWVLAGEETVPMGRSVLVGLVCSSHQEQATNTSTISHVRLTTPGAGPQTP